MVISCFVILVDTNMTSGDMSNEQILDDINKEYILQTMLTGFLVVNIDESVNHRITLYFIIHIRRGINICLSHLWLNKGTLYVSYKSYSPNTCLLMSCGNLSNQFIIG